MAKQMRYEPIGRNATCKRCGSTTVTWQQGTKWYLTEVFTVNGQEDMSAKTDFHSSYCGNPQAHNVEQQRHDHVYGEWQREHERIEQKSKQDADEREAMRIEAEAELLAAFLRMDETDRYVLITKLNQRKEAELEGITMDYMTEYEQALRAAAEIQAEIDMYLDFMEDVEDDD
jgi:hypothetical protein